MLKVPCIRSHATFVPFEEVTSKNPYFHSKKLFLLRHSKPLDYIVVWLVGWFVLVPTARSPKIPFCCCFLLWCFPLCLALFWSVFRFFSPSSGLFSAMFWPPPEEFHTFSGCLLKCFPLFLATSWSVFRLFCIFGEAAMRRGYPLMMSRFLNFGDDIHDQVVREQITNAIQRIPPRLLILAFPSRVWSPILNDALRTSDRVSNPAMGGALVRNTGSNWEHFSREKSCGRLKLESSLNQKTSEQGKQSKMSEHAVSWKCEDPHWAKNARIDSSGYSPAQWVIGRRNKLPWSLLDEGPSKSHECLREDGVANPRSEMETHGSSFARSERVVSARLPQTLDE